MEWCYVAFEGLSLCEQIISNKHILRKDYSDPRSLDTRSMKHFYIFLSLYLPLKRSGKDARR